MPSSSLPFSRRVKKHRLRFPSSAGDLIGAHLSTKGGLYTVFERATTVNASAVAIFSKNSSQWKAKELTDEDCALFAAERRKAGIQPLLIHTSYLINLATTNGEFYRKSFQAMVVELERAERLGAQALVLHPGAHLGAGLDKGIDQIARTFDLIHAATPACTVVTLLETTAGQGSCLGCTFEDLGKIIARVDDKSRLGICIDTCHIFAAGYDIRTRDGYERTIDDVEKHVGLDNVGAFHFNDSKRELGSRVDRHQHIGEGMIGLDAFGYILNDERFRAIPKLLETPKKPDPEADIRNLTTLRSLVTPISAPRKSRKRA